MGWPGFYHSLAKKLGNYSGKELLAMIRGAFGHETFADYLHFADQTRWEPRGYAIDPFTVMGMFNRGQTDAHRLVIAQKLAALFQAGEEPPACFHGIPHLDPRNSIYVGQEQMMALYEAAINGYANAAFGPAYDSARQVKGNGLGTLSIGLFWIAPNDFMAIDRVSAPFIEKRFSLRSPAEKCGALEYCEFMDALREKASNAGLTFPQITALAWQEHYKGEPCGK